MSRPRFYTDEDVYGNIPKILRREGYDAVSTPDEGRQQNSDESQLSWAAAEERTLITFNVAHFTRLHKAWLQQGKSHAGIIVSSQRPLGDTVRRLLNLANSFEREAMFDRLEYLSDW
jgi:uncharacterized protein with PIN domain